MVSRNNFFDTWRCKKWQNALLGQALDGTREISLMPGELNSLLNSGTATQPLAECQGNYGEAPGQCVNMRSWEVGITRTGEVECDALKNWPDSPKKPQRPPRVKARKALCPISSDPLRHRSADFTHGSTFTAKFAPGTFRQFLCLPSPDTLPRALHKLRVSPGFALLAGGVLWRYMISVRYPDGGGPTKLQREKREVVRGEAATLFAAGVDASFPMLKVISQASVLL